MFPRIAHIYGPLWINSYGAMIVLGLILFVYLTRRELVTTKKLMTHNEYANMIMAGVIGTFVGGRTYEVVTQWDQFKDNLVEAAYPWVGGFGILGGVFGAVFSLSFFLYMHGKKVFVILDQLALYAPLLQSISRVGCFLAGCCYGYPVFNLPWAVTYSDPACLAPLGIPLHPTQLYAAVASMCVFLLLLTGSILVKQRQHGDILWAYIVFEGIGRAVVEFWRGDQNSSFTTSLPLTSAHLFSLLLIILGVGGFFSLRLFCSTKHTHKNIRV